MIHIDFKNLILDEEYIDIFNPIEQLNGQCLCDFYLMKSELIGNRLRDQILSAESGNLNNSLIEKFIGTTMNKTD